MKIEGIQLNRPDLHLIAAELDVATKDVLVENGVLTIYNTSKTSQEIVAGSALLAFVAMTLEIELSNISELTPVKAKPKILERDDFMDDEEE